MGSRDMLAKVLAALHDATLNAALWPRASALIDDACGATGNAIVVSEGLGDDARVRFRAGYYRGVRNEDLEEDYFRNYHYRDERVRVYGSCPMAAWSTSPTSTPNRRRRVPRHTTRRLPRLATRAV